MENGFKYGQDTWLEAFIHHRLNCLRYLDEIGFKWNHTAFWRWSVVFFGLLTLEPVVESSVKACIRWKTASEHCRSQNASDSKMVFVFGSDQNGIYSFLDEVDQDSFMYKEESKHFAPSVRTNWILSLQSSTINVIGYPSGYRSCNFELALTILYKINNAKFGVNQIFRSQLVALPPIQISYRD